MSHAFISLLLGAVIISVLHASLPNHWLPFVLIGKAQGWSRGKVLSIVALAGTAHVGTTVGLGFLVAWIGLGILKTVERLADPLSGGILVLIGGTYMLLDLKGKTSVSNKNPFKGTHLSDRAAMASLLAMLTFSPCEAVLPVFFAASPFGWKALFLLSSIMAAATVTGMVFLTGMAETGISRLKFSFLERHEKAFFGLVMALLGGAVILLY